MAELVREIVVDATPETIWPCLTDPAKHVEWDGTRSQAGTTAHGGVYRVLVAGQYLSAGTYTEVVPLTRKLAFTFGWEQDGNPIRPGSTTVEIALHPEGDGAGGGCHVHSGLPANAVDDHGGAVGRTTSTASPCGPAAATRGPTAGTGSVKMMTPSGCPRPGSRHHLRDHRRASPGGPEPAHAL